jgi:uncharacterized protein YutD
MNQVKHAVVSAHRTSIFLYCHGVCTSFCVKKRQEKEKEKKKKEEKSKKTKK